MEAPSGMVLCVCASSHQPSRKGWDGGPQLRGWQVNFAFSRFFIGYAVIAAGRAANWPSIYFRYSFFQAQKASMQGPQPNPGCGPGLSFSLPASSTGLDAPVIPEWPGSPPSRPKPVQLLGMLRASAAREAGARDLAVPKIEVVCPFLLQRHRGTIINRVTCSLCKTWCVFCWQCVLITCKRRPRLSRLCIDPLTHNVCNNEH